MPPKRDTATRAGGVPASKAARSGFTDYPRPFYQRSLTRSEIQEDIAQIQSSMKREHRAPARYGASAPARGETGTPPPTAHHHHAVADNNMNQRSQAAPMPARQTAGYPQVGFGPGRGMGQQGQPMRQAGPMGYQSVVPVPQRYMVGS